jgi:hypothetical protein
MYINLRLFDDAIEANVNSQIIEVVSEYFLNLARLDRVPRKDMINIISAIDGVDSVDVRFVSKKNEDYHKRFITTYEDALTASNNSPRPTLTANSEDSESTDVIRSKFATRLASSVPDLNKQAYIFDEIVTSTEPTEKYDPKKVLGIDKTLGDIIFEPFEYPIIRGGWKDRNDIYYSEVPLDGFSSINISVKGITPRKKTYNR